MYENIRMPYDGSDEANKAAVHGIELAAEVGSTIYALYVVDLPGVPRALSLRDDEEHLRREYREYGEEILDEICSLATEYGVDCKQVIRTGTVSEEIVDYADEEGMDAIVIGIQLQGKGQLAPRQHYGQGGPHCNSARHFASDSRRRTVA